MITGIGTDIIDIRRIEKALNEKLIARIFTDAEREYCEQKRPGGGHVAAYARRFAAKEACAKALGTGIGKTVSFKDIEVTKDENGKPNIKIHSNIPAFQHSNIHLSMSDDPPYAIAYVVIEKRDKIVYDSYND